MVIFNGRPAFGSSLLDVVSFVAFSSFMASCDAETASLFCRWNRNRNLLCGLIRLVQSVTVLEE